MLKIDDIFTQEEFSKLPQEEQEEVLRLIEQNNDADYLSDEGRIRIQNRVAYSLGTIFKTYF